MKSLKKKIYEKPSFRVVELRHKANILAGSPVRNTPPEEIPDYDDWFGARRHKGAWEDEEDLDEEE
jgi:hypothetical protein